MLLQLVVYLSFILRTTAMNRTAIGNRTAAVNHTAQQRISGGLLATLGKYPIVTEIYENQVHICGATLISTNAILTAAMCFDQCNATCLKFRRVIVGDVKRSVSKVSPETRTKHKVRQAILHESYKSGGSVFNIALAQISPMVIVSGNVKISKLSYERPKVGTLCSVIGWGFSHPEASEYPELLMVAKVSIMDADQCSKHFEDFDASSMICAGDLKGKQGACFGDSGGPLLCPGKYQVGLMSLAKNCSGEPGAYTDIAKHYGWINKIMSEVIPDADDRDVQCRIWNSSNLVKSVVIVVFLLYIS